MKPRLFFLILLYLPYNIIAQPYYWEKDPLGNSYTHVLNGKVGIGTSTPQAKLHFYSQWSCGENLPNINLIRMELEPSLFSEEICRHNKWDIKLNSSYLYFIIF